MSDKEALIFCIYKCQYTRKSRKDSRMVINMKQRVYKAWRRKLTAYSAVLRPLADLINRASLITALSPKIMP